MTSIPEIHAQCDLFAWTKSPGVPANCLSGFAPRAARALKIALTTLDGIKSIEETDFGTVDAAIEAATEALAAISKEFEP